MKMVTPMDLKANGHYTPGVLAGGMLYISGQLPIEPVTSQIINGDAGEQCQRALFNLDKVLMAAGLSRDAVVSVHIYAADIQDWDKINEAYAAFFGGHKPARVIVPSGHLHYGAKVEIEAIAEARGFQID